MASDCGVFLPPYDNVTIYFLKDLISMKKRYLKTEEIKTIYVPFYENLTLAKIGAFAMEQPNIMEYMPD